MKIGISTDYNNIQKVEQIGFDYLETNLFKIASLNETEFAEAYRQISTSKIKVEVCNCLLSAQFKLMTDNNIEEKLEKYLHIAFNRCNKLGTKIVVFGSGRSRTIPEGLDKIKAWEKLKKICLIIGNIANVYNLTVVFEPLNKLETNIINTVQQGAQLVREVNHDNIKLLVDYYHMAKENEPIKNIIAAQELIKHVHIANGETRKYPINKEKYLEFFEYLKNIKYDKRISIEGKTDNFEQDAVDSLKMLKNLV